MLISPALAQTAASTQEHSAFAGLWIFVLFFVIMYFFIIRPQRQQMKKREEMLNAIHRNDKIITGGGILGRVTKIHEESDELSVEIAPNVEVRILRSTVSNIRVKDEAGSKKIKTEKSDPKSKNKDTTDERLVVEEVNEVSEKTEKEKS